MVRPMKKHLIILLLCVSAGLAARPQWSAQESQSWWDETEWVIGLTLDLPQGNALPADFADGLQKCRDLGGNAVQLRVDCTTPASARLKLALAAVDASGLKAVVATAGTLDPVPLCAVFAQDKRILAWNLLPEPEKALEGVQEVIPVITGIFEAVRAKHVRQPLCAALDIPYPYSDRPFGRMDIFSAISLQGDIVAFRCKGPVKELENAVRRLSVFRRPLLCVDFLDREGESTLDRCLPLLKKEKVGVFCPLTALWPDGKTPCSVTEPEVLRRQAMKKGEAGKKPSFRETGWGISAPDPARVKQWTAAQARAWWAKQEWPVGCMMTPCGTRNQYDVWQAETFDPASLTREFNLCKNLGFNLVRLYLHEDMWLQDAAGFKARIDEVLSIAAERGIRVTFTFCTNGGSSRPFPDGKQPAGAGWVQSPKDDIFFDESRWPQFKAYMQDILRTFGHDERILYWLLWNEPENLRSAQRRRDVMKIMAQMYEWAWEVRPDQPLSSSPWFPFNPDGSLRPRYDVEAFAHVYSDICVFHCYRPPLQLEKFIKTLSQMRRPMVCEEYMSRELGSYFDFYLPVLKREKIAAINWGLVHSLSPGEKPEAVWTHGIFYNDAKTPYIPAEVDFIRSICADKSTAGQGALYPLE